MMVESLGAALNPASIDPVETGALTVLVGSIIWFLRRSIAILDALSKSLVVIEERTKVLAPQHTPVQPRAPQPTIYTPIHGVPIVGPAVERHRRKRESDE